MGNVMHTCMTTSEENIEHEIQNKKVAAVTYKDPSTSAITPVVKDKENSNADLIPFEPNFKDQDVPDFDLMAIMNDIEKELEPDHKCQ